MGYEYLQQVFLIFLGWNDLRGHSESSAFGHLWLIVVVLFGIFHFVLIVFWAIDTFVRCMKRRGAIQKMYIHTSLNMPQMHYPSLFHKIAFFCLNIIKSLLNHIGICQTIDWFSLGQNNSSKTSAQNAPRIILRNSLSSNSYICRSRRGLFFFLLDQILDVAPQPAVAW